MKTDKELADLKCPKCGKGYELGPVTEGGWQSVSIGTATVYEDKRDGTPPFFGMEYWCGTCDHRWRVAK